MEISVQYTCNCNNKKYPSMQSLNAHKKTKGHLQWENDNELRNLKITLTEKDNEIVGLTNKVNMLRELNTQLLTRIKLDM